MNDGVALLLERMKTNPEEFIAGEGIIGKWNMLIREYETALNPEDVALFKQARNKLLQQQFTEKVMEELVDPKKSDNWADSIMQAKGIALGGATPALYTPKFQHQAHVEHIKAHLEVLEIAKKASEK
jgi:hypothetical protein